MMWYNGAAYEEPIWVLEQIGLAELDGPELLAKLHKICGLKQMTAGGESAAKRRDGE